ncbi:MAG: HAMP domain-containing protein [Chlorobium sp.]|jgi:heavy metal sensor kinase|nr:HAMP domain-containing protein [Chlorobium sp.]
MKKSPFKGPSVMSLRNRIAFYYTIATAFLIAIVFTTIFFMVEKIVYKQFDDQLKKEISEIFADSNISPNNFQGFDDFKNNIDAEEGGNDNDHERKHKNNKLKVDTEFIQLVNTSGEVINKSASLSWCVLAFNPKQSGTSYFNSNFGGSMVRQAQVPLTNQQGVTEGYLIIAVPLKNALIVLHDLRDIFLFSFPVILLPLFLLTRSIAIKSIRPIEKVIATAEKMSQSNLDQRIPLPFHHDELYRLAATINALFDRMQDAFQREKHFTADASHELKTPLAVVKGTLEVLIRKPREREHYETRIQFCLKELNRMARLIDQLLMLARYESNKMTPHIMVTALSPLVENVVERMIPTARTKGIAITVNRADSAHIAADPGMLDMIFENIISNAIKYSSSGSSIAIEVKHSADNVICSISDQGIGIPEEMLNAIFERFYRVDESRSSSTGGLGLGLSIVKKLADLQQIKVTVTSATNRGTTFTLTCPAAHNIC